MKEYQKHYRQFWRPILEKKGKLNKQQLMRELFDYSNLCDAAAQVYRYATGGAVGKLNATIDSMKKIIDEVRGRDIMQAVENYAILVGLCPVCRSPIADDARRKGWIVCKGETCTWEKQLNFFNEVDCPCHCHMTAQHVVDGRLCVDCEKNCKHCRSLKKSMTLSKETQELVKKLVSRWEELKAKHFPYKGNKEYGSEFDSIIGHINWNNPNLIWVLVTENEESYEGSQAQVGVDKEGKLRWEYQSHCSCNSYEDSTDTGAELDMTKKSFELDGLPLDWEIVIRRNIQTLLA